MKLRQKSKRDQALDAVASIAKTWSEWRLGEKVSTTASQASKKASKKAGKASKHAKKHAAKASVPAAAKRRPVWIAGAVALVGGIGAAAAKKFTGGKAEPLYTPAGPASDTSSPPPAAGGDSKADTEVPSTTEPALTASTQPPPRDPSPVVLEDLATDAPAEGEPGADAEPPGSDGDSPDLVSEGAGDSDEAGGTSA
jgi:hypothetical protein